MSDSRLQSAPQAIERWAVEEPDRVFIEEADGDRRVLTYGESIREARRWMAAFERAGVVAGDRVATMLPSSVDGVSCWMGLAWLRALDAGIHPDYRGATLRSLLERVGPTLIVVSAENAEAVRDVVDGLDGLRSVVVIGEVGEGWPAAVEVTGIESFLGGVDVRGEVAAPQRHETACIVFTSGTTGPSKAVLVPWGNYWSSLPVWHDLGPDDAFYSPFPLCHSAGRSPMTWIGVPGGRWVIRNTFRTDAFWPDIARHGCTATQMIPAMITWSLSRAMDDEISASPLRKIVTAPLTADVVEMQRRFGLRVRTVYGMSEIGMAIHRMVEAGDEIESAGLVTPGYEVRIVDENDYEVPVGEVGELVVRAAEPWSLNSGYFAMPEATAAAWRNGWFHTGDGLRQREDGAFVFVDRLKDSIRRRGENVSSQELEALVLAVDGVVECAVVGIDAGGDEQEIKLCAVVADGAALTASDLVEAIRPQVPGFMLPRFVELLDALPRTDVTNRVKKRELRDAGVTAATWDRLAVTNPASGAN